jgi:hypothetical protein
MLKKLLTSLRESPFIEGMGRIFDFFGIINSAVIPAKSDAEALNDDWEKVLGDFNHTIIIKRRHCNGRKAKYSR